MRVLIALDLDDGDLTEALGSDPNTTAALAGSGWDDLCNSLDARVSEFYIGPHHAAVRGRVVAAADFSGPDALPALLDAAEVGVEGVEPEDVAVHVAGSLVTFRQHFDADGR